MASKMGKSKVGWKIPPNEGFKGKIKLNGGFLRPSLPKGQSFFFGSSESKYGIWWPGDPQPCGLENGDIDFRFPCFPDLVRYKRRAGDIVWNSSEKDDLKFRHLFVTVETSWNILEDLCLPRFFSRLSYFHSRRRRKPRGTALGLQRVGQTLQVRSW